jgi:hypothetical protein
MFFDGAVVTVGDSFHSLKAPEVCFSGDFPESRVFRSLWRASALFVLFK